MRKILFFLCLIMLSTTAALAQNGCMNIRNEGLRSYCLAKTQQQAVFCYGIKNSDSRNMCLARFASSFKCYSIKDYDLRNFCHGVYSKNAFSCQNIKNNYIREYCNREIAFPPVFKSVPD